MSVNGHLGDIPIGAVIPLFWTSHDAATGATETMSGLAVTDIEIYKGVSMTQRSSDNGYVLIDTDGIDLDSTTGLNGISIDTGDNSDAGFFASGSFYNVVVTPVTVDGQTLSIHLCSFRAVTAEGVAGQPKVDMAAILGTAVSTPATAGILDVNVKNIDNDAASASGTVTFPNATVASTTNITAGTITTATNVTTVNGLAANVITATSINADAITDAKVAADVTIASVTGAVGSVTGAVGSVTGNVGGNVTGSVGSVVGAVGSVTGLTAATVHSDLDDIQARLPAALTAGGNIKADALALSGDTVAADNAESFFDGTGYAGTNNVIPLVTTTTTATNLTTNNDKTGYTLSNAGVDALFVRALTEAYAADGAAPTVAQALFAIQQFLQERSVAGTTMTVKKLDGSTTAYVITLNDGTTPTSYTRSS